MLSETIILPKSIGGQENRFIVQLKAQLLKQIKEINKMQKNGSSGESSDFSDYYTKGEVNNLINTRLSELVSSAPQTLDTLEELADALGDDPNFATTVVTQLGNKLNKTSPDYIKDIAISGTTVTITRGDNTTDTETTQDTIVSVPTKTSDLTNDSGFITSVSWNDIANKPSAYPPSTHTHPEYLTSVSWGDVSNKPSFATVATSGSYNDLSNKPTIPTIPTNVSAFTNDIGYITGIAWDDVTNKPTTFPPSTHTHSQYLTSVSWGDVLNKPAFSTVATSGSYNDLSDKPTIPQQYVLPKASSNTLGGIMVGTDLSIDSNGVLSTRGLLPLSGGTMSGTIIEEMAYPSVRIPYSVKFSNITLGTAPSSSKNGYQFGLMDSTNNSVIGGLYYSITSGGISSVRLYNNWHKDFFVNLYSSSGGQGFFPNINNGVDLGSGNYRWRQLYAGTATINTSDERIKDNIKPIDDEVLDAWGEVGWYQFQFKDALKSKGRSARLHTGTIAQRIKSVFEKRNLDAFRYGLLCYDEWEMDEENQAGNIYSIRYEEALCMEAAYQRRRADQLEERIKRLEEKL